MRSLFILFIAVLLVVILDYSDFFLTRLIRNRITEINEHASRSFAYKPLSRPNLFITALLFWFPPFYLLGDNLILEYKIFITILYWTGVSILLIYYLRKRSSKKTARESLPFLISFAVASGLFLGPVFTAINAYLGL